MKSQLYWLGIALSACLSGPAMAGSSPPSPTPVKAQGPAQVTVTERDAREKIVTVQTTDLPTAVSIAADRVPGALSGNPADVKSLTITYN